MFTKFKGIFSSKQSSGKADEYFGSSKSKKKHVIIGQSVVTHDGWAVSHPQGTSNQNFRILNFVGRGSLCRCDYSRLEQVLKECPLSELERTCNQTGKSSPVSEGRPGACQSSQRW